MDKSTQIKAQLVGQNALVVLIALFANHFAKKYQIEVSSDTIMLAAAAVGAWWTNRHVNKTAALIDTLANSNEKMTVDEGKALAAIATEVQSKGLAGPITGQTVTIAKEVARVRELVPQATVQDVLERTQNR